MSEIVATITVSVLMLYAAILGTNWILHGRWGGPRQRQLFARWAVYQAVLMAALTGWILAAIAVFLYGNVFWQGAWVGASAALWLGYVPALVWMIRVGRRQEAEARAADAGLAE